jgi:seryl-tRNA synthetase
MTESSVLVYYGFMLDIKFIREHQAELKEAIKNKNITLNLDELLAADAKRVEFLREIELLKESKNKLNDEISAAKTDDDRKAAIAKGKEVKEKLAEIEPKFVEVNSQFEQLMVRMPTIPSPDTPIGKGEEDNIEVFRWIPPDGGSGKEPKKFDFTPKTHIELGTALDILDFERGTKVGGFRSYFVKNDGVLLQMGLMMYVIEKMVAKGFAPMIPPTLIKEFALFGSGYFKGTDYDPAVDEIYQVTTPDKEATGEISKEKKFLVGTAEPSLLAYYSGETLKADQLPMRMSGFSQCYRSEIGSYSKDVKGMYRVHEFMKVEQIILAPADIKLSIKLQDEMLAISGELHEDLGLSYRRLAICTGDLSAGKYRQFDTETWLPGMNRWAETGSGSNFLDWQSRRLNVKYVDGNDDKKFVYMLNNTALPSPRTFIAILENYQRADGKIDVPEVLQKYVGKKVIG